MEMSQLSSKLRKLGENEKQVIYTSKKGVKITATQTGKFSPNDFAVGLIVPDKEEFRPTHIRVLVDLYIKKESNLEGSRKLFRVLEEVFKGKDPELYAENLRKLDFPMQLDEAEVNVFVIQLLMIEQDFNYGPGAPKTSKFEQPREFLMRFIRWVASGDTQIDRILSGAARNYPAPDRYSKPLNFDETPA